MNQDDKPNMSQPNLPAERQAQAEDTNARSLTRRNLARAGLGAPVLMTLMSKPAFGAQCLSNMLSGNLSDPKRGNCNGGWSPGGWKNPVGMIHTYGTIAAWTKAGYSYGTLISGGDPTKAEDYSGGSKWNTTPFTLPTGAPSGIRIREVLINYPGTLHFHLAAAWLNANLSKNDSTFMYIVTPQQLTNLASGATPIPPGYANLQDFLDKNYHVT